MTKVKKLKALLGFKGTSDTDLIQQLINVEKGMTGNPNFPNTPVDLAVFKSGIDTLTVPVTEAADGGKRAITAKNKQRDVMIRQVTLLGHDVELASNDDSEIFATSRFVAAPTTRVPPQPLSTRRNLRISGSCAGPVGLHRLERSNHVHLRLT